MSKLFSFTACVVLLAVVTSPGVYAQQATDQASVEERRRQADEARIRKAQEEVRIYEQRLAIVVPLDVEVVVSRYQGDKKLSSLPYSLIVNAVHRESSRDPVAQIRMGAQVPLPSMAAPTVDGKPVTGMLTTNPVQYKEIGTFIDAHAKWLDGGAFELHVSVSDTSLYMRSANAPAAAEQIEDMGLPVLRTFTAANSVVLKDGQTKQFMLAADRISGDTLRVDVTLKISK